MFENVGRKLMSLAQISAWIGIIGSWIWGFVTWVNIADSYHSKPGMGLLMFLLIAGVGSLSSWLSSLVVYGIGEVVDNTERILGYQMYPEQEDTKYIGIGGSASSRCEDDKMDRFSGHSFTGWGDN